MRVVLALALGVLLALGAATPPTSTPPRQVGVGACITEDSASCYWNADTKGNHGGRDLINP